MKQYINKHLQKAEEFIENLDPDSKILIVSHSDGDGVTSAALISRLLDEKEMKQQSMLFLLARGNEAKEKITRKTREENADTVIFLDYTPNQETYRELNDKKMLTIDHHPGRKAPEKGVYINPQKETPPAASVLCHLLYEKMNGEKNTKSWALIGAHSDTRIKQSLPLLDLSEEEKELYIPSGRLNWDLAEVAGTTVVAYFDKTKAKEVYEYVKKSIEQENPMLIQEEKYGETKHLYDIIEKAERQKINKTKDNPNLEADKESKLVILPIDTELRIKNIIASHLRLKYPEYTIAVRMENGENYMISFRGGNPDLSKAVPKACRGINASGGGHPQAAGATVSKKDYKRFIKNLKRELKKRLSK